MVVPRLLLVLLVQDVADVDVLPELHLDLFSLLHAVQDLDHDLKPKFLLDLELSASSCCRISHLLRASSYTPPRQRRSDVSTNLSSNHVKTPESRTLHLRAPSLDEEERNEWLASHTENKWPP